MFQMNTIETDDKGLYYTELYAQAKNLLAGETDLIANMANFCSLIYYQVPELNWAGFYLYKNNELIVGPFQGKPACVRIKIGRGVCGTAAEKMETMVVENVHEFPGHIACDSASNSEIVIPVIKNNKLVGVLDLDSPKNARFDQQDKKGLEKLVELFVESIVSTPEIIV